MLENLAFTGDDWKPAVPAIAWERRLLMPGMAHFAAYRLMRHGAFTGWQVRHCGHQTAIRPYYIVRPDGAVIDRKYRLLDDAKASVIAAIGQEG